MSLACEALGIPVVSGNVSLYNETDGVAIHPTPVVGCVGLVPDVRRIPSRWEEGDAVYVVGAPELALDGSEYQARFLGGPSGRPPRPHLGAEAALVRFLWRAAPRLTASHDVSEGGLAVALAELALWSGMGARIELEDDAVIWFGEGGGQRVADEFGVPLLGQIPLEMETREGGDAGVPITVGQPDSAQAQAFRTIAAAAAARVEAVAALKLPSIG